MPEFNTISSPDKITLDSRWVPAGKFDSKDRLCPSIDPKKPGTYRLIAKRERLYSTFERVGRGFLGVLAVICTLSIAYFYSKSVKKLLTKTKATQRFAILAIPAKEEPKAKTEENVKPNSAEKTTEPKRIAVSSESRSSKTQTPLILEHEKIAYSNPELLKLGTHLPDNRVLDFAVVETAGIKKLVAVTKKEDENKWLTYDGSPLEALYMLCHAGSPIYYILKHPYNSEITENAFIKFLLETDQDKPRIFTLNAGNLFGALKIIQKNKIPINLNEKTSEGITLFSLWAGKGFEEITQILLELDPNLIEQVRSQTESPFIKTALVPSKKETILLLNAMKERGITLSTEEMWIQRAVENDWVFDDDEFLSLSQNLKEKIYFVANAFDSITVVKTLNRLGMNQEPWLQPGPHIFARNMDIVTLRDTAKTFLRNTRQDSLLLTQQEFGTLDKDNYILESNNLGSIQGRNFIEKIAQENELDFIKVPRQIAVIKEGIQDLSFYIQNNTLYLENNPIEIYAKKIKSLGNRLSLKGAVQLMIALEKTGFQNFSFANIAFAKDGIYFINTDINSFDLSNPRFSIIKSIKTFLTDPTDAEEFLKIFEERRKAFYDLQSQRDLAKKEFEDKRKNKYNDLSSAYVIFKSSFALSSLLKTK